MSDGVMEKVKVEGRGEVFGSVDDLIAEVARLRAEREEIADYLWDVINLDEGEYPLLPEDERNKGAALFYRLRPDASA